MNNNSFKDDIFNCTQCGDCCRGYGGTVISEADMDAIARYIKTDTAVFRKAYCQRLGDRFMIAQKDDGYCIFWDRNCTIHPVKPKMCRAWPYLKSVLVDIGNWGAMANSCPGIRVDAPDHVVRAVIAKALEDRGEKTECHVG